MRDFSGGMFMEMFAPEGTSGWWCSDFTRFWYQATAAERCLLWWGAEVVMVNVEAMRVAWYGGAHVRFLGFGHTLMIVVECALFTVIRHDNMKSSSKKSVGSSFVIVMVLVRGIDACVWNAIGLWLRWINMELLLYLYTRINVCFENGLKWFI